MTDRPVIEPGRPGSLSPARRSILVASLAAFATPASSQTWAPSAQMKEETTAFLERWAALVEGERYADAYALLSSAAKSRRSLAQWADLEHRFRVRAGALKSHVVKKLIWSNNPARAPLPGVYVVAVYDGSFEKVGPCFEVVTLHRPPGGEFTVLRHQRTVLADEKEKALHERRTWLLARPG